MAVTEEDIARWKSEQKDKEMSAEEAYLFLMGIAQEINYQHPYGESSYTAPIKEIVVLIRHSGENHDVAIERRGENTDLLNSTYSRMKAWDERRAAKIETDERSVIKND